MKKKLVILSILALSSVVLFAWCKKTQEDVLIIQEWDKVTINYDSYLLDWEIVEENTIQTFTIWWKNSFPIFNTELLWLQSWDTKTFTTNDPQEWYWIYHDDLKVQKISTTVISTIWADPKIWSQINLWSLNWVILEVSPIDVTIDFNERQTRENVEFNITVLGIEKSVNQ